MVVSCSSGLAELGADIESSKTSSSRVVLNCPLLWLRQSNLLKGIDNYLAVANQIYFETFMCLKVDTSFIFTKNQTLQFFFDISNAEIAQCRQNIDVI